MDLTMQRRQLALALAAALLFLAAAWASGLVARQANGLATLWAGNAVLLAILLIQGRGRGDIVAIAGGGLAAGIALHLWRHSPPAIMLGFSIANVAEALVTLFVLRALDAATLRFEAVREVGALAIACVAGATASTLIAVPALQSAHDVPFDDAWLGWFAENALSLLVIMPMIVLCARIRWGADASGRTMIETLAVLVLVAIGAGVIFFAASAPVLFLAMPLVMMATVRLRTLGAVAAVAAVAIVAVIGAAATGSGHGPIVHNVARVEDQVLLLQLFLATVFLSTLPVAAVLAERDAEAAAGRLLAERYQAVVENIGEVIFRFDADGRWLYLNPAWERLSGETVAASLGQSWLARFQANDRSELIDHVQPVLSGQIEMTHLELQFDTAAGIRWVEMLLQPLRDVAGRIVGATGTVRDIDDRKQLEQHVSDAHRRAEERASEATVLASTDELTGIANRREFLRHLDQQIAHAIDRDAPLALAIFDVDHFKAVNDRHGHAVGDHVLRRIAARANAVIRHGDVVGRLGGEEFGVVMPGASAEDARIIAERLREGMEMPRVDDVPALPRITISVGLAVRQRHGDATALLAVADAALYAAKNEGRNRVRIAA